MSNKMCVCERKNIIGEKNTEIELEKVQQTKVERR